MATTVSGGVQQFNFVAQVEPYTGIGLDAFKVDYGNPPEASDSAVAVVSGTDNVVPDGVGAVFDALGGDTLTGGASDLRVYLQGGMATEYVAGSGDSTVFAGGADTVVGGSGKLAFIGGAGAVSVQGGAGESTLIGGTAASVLVAGSGNSTLVGGTGPSVLVGGHNAEMFAAGDGPTQFFAGSGLTIVHGNTGTGAELVSTNSQGNSGVLIAQLNGASDTVVGGSGAATVIGGAGKDTYGFIAGHAGGTEAIYGLKSGDQIVFGGYAGNPIKSEAVSGGSDHITLTDGTQIDLVGIDHKVF